MRNFALGMATAESLTLAGYYVYAPFFDWLTRHL